MPRRHLQSIAMPSRAEVARVSAEAEDARRRLAYEAGRFAEVFGAVLEIYTGRRKKPDDDQRNDQ